MALEHTFIGTWEIVSCTFEGKRETSGLEGIKFRLDDTSDITWYNDLVSPLPESKDCITCCDSASVLFSCETFEVNESNPRLVFGAFVGHSIEFKTNTLEPTDILILECENWYALECKRLKEGQAAGQEKEFSFITALEEAYFSDVIIKSSCGLDYHVHSSILRLNGFDCSMCIERDESTIAVSFQQPICKTHEQCLKPVSEQTAKKKQHNQIKISLTTEVESDESHMQKSHPRLHLSPLYLHPPVDTGVLAVSNRASSFNCLMASGNSQEATEIGRMKKYLLTSSDSHLETNYGGQSKNIFNFCNDLLLNPVVEPSVVYSNRRPPLSPYRARSPSPFPISMDTPPSSPLTPVGILNNLPSFLLTPILHWLYTESLIPNMNEDMCEKLINLAETQPPLTKMVEPCRKYLKLIRLKKFAINIIMDLHNILNKMIQRINPITISHQPVELYSTFKDCLRECAVGCAKILQFCNIFIKDAADISRYQKNEIVKYVRTRIPIFTSEIHQLLKNILSVFTSLNSEEKSELVNYLVPEIESTLLVLTNVIEEIKNSLEKMCKHLKCSHLDLSMKNEDAVAEAYNIKTSEFIASDENSVNLFSGVPLRRLPHAISLLHDASTDKQRLIAAGNDLKFVLYMYEVRKMRDIYGRISTALDIIRDKKSAFCEMNFLSKQSTIHQNLEQLILDIPSYILIVENLSERLDDKIGWKEFKFCFKLATSQINGVIVKLFDHKSALKDPITHVCKLVQKEEFTKSMIDLGLLEPTNILQSKKENEGYRDRNPLERQITYESVKLNLIKHLCEPPIAANSTLSKNALRLLHSAQLADMEFEVQVLLNNQLYPCEAVAVMQSQRQNNASDNYGDCISEERGVEQKKRQRSHIEQLQVHTFRAHRVIVSARCEWFKKALLSGMQESINRKIIITDTSPVIFRRLLLYLYGAPIDKTVGAEQICELMLLADRYSIEDLKELCENTLNSLIDEDSVVCLLGIADRYIAGVLKSKCLSFLSQHSNLTKLEMFKQLPQSIQHEVKELIHWYDRVSEPWNDGFKSRSNSRHSLKSPSKPRSRSRKSSPSYI